MIICKDNKVEITVTGGELMQTMIDHETTVDIAMAACIGNDLTNIFKELVEIYNADKAATLWTLAVEAYKDVILKGETSHDDN